jgi:hypothetical protein
MAASAMVTIAAVTTGVGLSMILVWTKPPTRPQHLGAIAIIIQEYASADIDRHLFSPADPAVRHYAALPRVLD